LIWNNENELKNEGSVGVTTCPLCPADFHVIVLSVEVR
jgi:hypothetical protein